MVLAGGALGVHYFVGLGYGENPLGYMQEVRLHSCSNWELAIWLERATALVLARATARGPQGLALSC